MHINPERATVLWRVLVFAAAAYGVIVALAWLFQHRLLYLPTVPGRDWVATPESLGMPYEDLRLATGDGVTLSAWWVPAQPQRGVLLFFHGNAGNISHRLESIEIFHRLGLSVLILDYRGYGQSGGHPSESGTYEDARAAWRYLTVGRGIPANEIVVFGRSLGAPIGAYLAREVTPAALILESPMTSAPDMAQSAYPFLPARWLTRFRYDAKSYVTEAECPVLVLHSEQDEIIPYSQGRSVFEAAPEPRRFLALRGGHNTGFLDSGTTYTDGIDDFIKELTHLPPVPGM